MTGSILLPSALAHLWSQAYVRNALIAGTAVAVAAGLVGYFVVLRDQTFSGDALSHVAFTGALGALAFGIDLRIGLFTATVLIAVLLGLLEPRGLGDDVVIGSVYAWVLGLGVLFLSVFTASGATGNSRATTSVLFGSVFGLDAAHTRVAVVIAVGVALCLLAMARPLLLASIDEQIAAARHVPVRALGVALLVLIGVTAGEATQAVGSLLLLGLLTGPAASAQLLTPRPYRALGCSAALATISLWAGLGLSYAAPKLPPSFAITMVILVIYAISRCWSRSGRRNPAR